jgi:AraC-like DNA-binding protein
MATLVKAILTHAVGTMNFVEYPIGAGANASKHDGFGILRCFRSPSFSDVIEAIWDCDIPDGDFAKALTIKCAPGTSLQLIGQYRRPAEIHQRAELLPTKCATHIQSHAVTLRPTGALGVVIVCLRPDAASRIVKAPLKEFANANLYLGDLFGTEEVAMCDEMLVAAHTSEERIAGIRSFLLRRLGPHTDSLANRAARYLRKTPTMQMNSLAAKLGSSPRQLSRAFKASFGVSPKRFARLARFQRILAERRIGGSWAQVAYACGLTDQAHLVDEFRDIVGEVPTAFFTREVRLGAERMDETSPIIQRVARTDRSIADS